MTSISASAVDPSRDRATHAHIEIAIAANRRGLLGEAQPDEADDFFAVGRHLLGSESR
jgi:hypothetical protein